VRAVLPLIAAVGKVSYLSSTTDMAVYGVTTEYLTATALRPIAGKIFESHDIAVRLPEQKGQVAGVSTKRSTGSVGETIQSVDFTVNPGAWIRVRDSASVNGKIIGYTKRVEGQGNGQEVWGEKYPSEDDAGIAGHDKNGNSLGKWVKANVLLWKSSICNPALQGDCENGSYLVLRDENNHQVQKTGYLSEVSMRVVGVNVLQSAQVLGASTSLGSKDDTGKQKSTGDWVEIASSAGIATTGEPKKVDISSIISKQAVVNRAMLTMLRIKEQEAVGKKFSVSFVLVGNESPDQLINRETTQTEYTITGITPEDKNPVFYVPFIDLRALGIMNFSQAKVMVNNSRDLTSVRRQIESMGYVTRSVSDTVAQIHNIFRVTRTILAMLGMLTLAVASLGMFNTLTVSLLERTREVGIMKAIGMKSSEVQELFLTESVIMGFLGGVLGLVFGWMLGKLVGILLSFFTLLNGAGVVDVSFVPLPFMILMVVLSVCIGLVTGIYPAWRATKISALNALRYE
jgi:hypothetical protein